MMIIVLPLSGFSQTYWEVNGNNVAAGKNKIGTINDYEVVFISNNLERMRLTNNTGYFGINTTTPTTYFDVNGQIRLRYNVINNGILTSDANGNATWSLLDLNLSGNTLSIQNQGSTVDLSVYLDNTDSQTLNLIGTNLSISNGNSVSFAGWDTDASDDFSGNYNDLSNLPSLFDGNWSSLQGTAPAISTFNNDVGYITNADDADADPINEIQDLQLNENILTITQNATATPIDLSIYNDNTDNQTLSLVGTELNILNGNEVVFTNWDTDVTDDFTGSYNDLTDKPTLFDGNYSSLIGIPTFATVAYSGDYNSLTNLPYLFDGNYSSLTGVPTIESINYWTKLNNNLYYSSGNVGVGISTPQKQIHIHNPNNSSIFDGGGLGNPTRDTRGMQISSESAFLLTNKNSGSTATDGLLIRSTNNNAYIYLQETGNLELLTKKALRFKMESSGNIAIGTIQNNYFVVKETGKIGIKTNDPTAAFDVNGDIRIRQGAADNYILTSNENGTGQWKELKLELNGNTLSITNHNTAVDLSGFNQTLSLVDQYLQLSNDGGSVALNDINYWSKNTNMIYYNLGNVGIGTNSPQSALHVNGNKLIIEENGKKLYLDADNGGVEIGSSTNQVTFWSAGNYNRIKAGDIISYGNVGIGTTDPQYMLDVRGSGHFCEVRVKTGDWCDFVFDDQYKLPDLYELEAFIKQNKHLPGIPTESEVVETGIDLGEMNKKLLEKIEELTLIIIEQNKVLMEQSKRISKLESLINN